MLFLQTYQAETAQFHFYTKKLHFGFVKPTASTATYYLQTSISGQTGGVGADYADKTTIVWEKWGTDYNGIGYGSWISTNSNFANAGVLKLSEECNMKSFLGFSNFYAQETAGTMASVGLTGGPTNLPAVQDLLTQPLLITSPDLAVKGFVGAGAGGGAEAQILGVMRTTTNIGLNQQHFAETTGDNFVKLNNPYPFTINRLNIIIKDFTNKETNILQPTTRLWMKFKCEGPDPSTKNIVVGGFSPNY